jgi:hypothetical protein
VWVPTVFTKNRERLLEAEVAHKFLAELLNHKEVRGLLSDEHFSVDGTQVAAWASMKSFRAKDGSDEPPSGGRNGERDFHGEKPSNDTHASATDPEARLYRKGKGKEAKLSYIGNALTENRHGLVVEAELGSAVHRCPLYDRFPGFSHLITDFRVVGPFRLHQPPQHWRRTWIRAINRSE